MSSWTHLLLSRRVVLLAVLAVVVALAVARAAGAYHTQFVATTCYYRTGPATPPYRRADAIAFAFIAAQEGYQWGGGCWNGNDVDDSPNDPPGDPNTGGEGGDCSGFTFKVWREALDANDKGFYWWSRLWFIHGPYNAHAFRVGDGVPNVVYSKGGLIRMDALASDSHIGMIYAVNANGTDQIIEAKGEAYGTGIWTRTYRSNPYFGGVRRLGWAM
jgi:hypothetical protein